MKPGGQEIWVKTVSLPAKPGELAGLLIQTFQVSRFDRDSPGLERTVPVSRSQVSRPGLRRPGVEIILHSPHGRFSTEIIHSLPPNSAYIVRSTYRTHLHNRSWITQAFYREIAI